MEHSPTDSHLIWTELEDATVLDAHVFSVKKHRRRSADGREATYFTLASPDWVNIVATTADETGRTCFVMVRQFRHGSMRVSLEFPGGVVDPGEDPRAAVVRELEEETGYVADSVQLAGSVNPNPALMGNRCHTFVARDVRRARTQDLDHNEIIDVVLVPVDEIDRLNGEFDHAIMHVALGFYERSVRSRD
jgi:8-oxo-dGTP pyrophosphatase MutT (NUDIX family)